MKLKIYLVLFAALFGVMLFGCQKLDPAGPYHGNVLLHDADTTIDTTHIALQAFVSWEKTNEVFLMTNAPAITRAADLVREKGPSWIQTAIRARDQYEQLVLSFNPTTNDLASASNTLQQAVSDLKIDAANANKQQSLVKIP